MRWMEQTSLDNVTWLLCNILLRTAAITKMVPYSFQCHYSHLFATVLCIYSSTPAYCTKMTYYSTIRCHSEEKRFPFVSGSIHSFLLMASWPVFPHHVVQTNSCKAALWKCLLRTDTTQLNLLNVWLVEFYISATALNIAPNYCIWKVVYLIKLVHLPNVSSDLCVTGLQLPIKALGLFILISSSPVYCE